MGVVPLEINEWKPLIAPQAMVINAKGKRLPAKTGPLPSIKRVSAGICNTGGNLFGLVAPILTPFLSHQVMRLFDVKEQVGWQWGIALGGLVCLIGAVLWLWIDPHER